MMGDILRPDFFPWTFDSQPERIGERRSVSVTCEMPSHVALTLRRSPCHNIQSYFNSTDQYAFSRKVFHDWYFVWVSFKLSIGLRLGFSGLRMSVRCASRGVRPPLRTLQSRQAQTMF